jgi:hypothetical protein
MQLLNFLCAISCLPWITCIEIGYKYLIQEFNYIQGLIDDNVSSIFIIYETTTVGDMEQLQIQDFVSKAAQENLLAKAFILSQK